MRFARDAYSDPSFSQRSRGIFVEEKRTSKFWNIPSFVYLLLIPTEVFPQTPLRRVRVASTPPAPAPVVVSGPRFTHQSRGACEGHTDHWGQKLYMGRRKRGKERNRLDCSADPGLWNAAPDASKRGSKPHRYPFICNALYIWCPTCGFTCSTVIEALWESVV